MRGRTRPSIPPASPHRAGHYSGLHPEDQPYQSSMIAIQRPPVQALESPRASYQEPERIVLPIVDSVPKPELSRQVVVPSRRNTLPDRVTRLSPSPKQPFLSGRAIPIALTLSCIFFLLATAILAFALTGRRTSAATAVLVANPSVLRADDPFSLTGRGLGHHHRMLFTYDMGKSVVDESGKPLEAYTDDMGAFSLLLRVSESWGPGQHILYATDEVQKLTIQTLITVQQSPMAPPHLQLSNMRLDVGSGGPGTVASRSMTLLNAGGGKITWQESSDATWLTASPSSDTFSGQESVKIMVNRDALTPQTYTGHITFDPKDGAPPLQLTVTMEVEPAPAGLTVSTSGLAYSGSTTQNPGGQSITLKNDGGQPLDWRSTVGTGDGVPWLTISPANGHLDPGTEENITVSVQSTQLSVGVYQGTIGFIGGVNPQVNVTLAVIAPGNLVVSPPALTLTAIAGQSPKGQSIIIQNSGGQSLNWTVNATTADQGTWLSAIPANGSLDPGAQTSVTVGVNGTALKASASYQGTLTFTAGGLTRQVAISLTVTPVPAPAISVRALPLNFTTYKGSNPAPQNFTITNTGNAALNWTTTEDSTIAPVTPSFGKLATAASAILTVSPNVANAGIGTLTTTITVRDSDAGSTVTEQKIVVAITIKGQAQITVSDKALTFNNPAGYVGSTGSITLSNTGNADLNWVTVSGVSWLSVDVASGTLSAGQNAVLNLHCDSSQLAPATYTTTFEIKDNDAGTPVASQVIQITLVVG